MAHAIRGAEDEVAPVTTVAAIGNQNMEKGVGYLQGITRHVYINTNTHLTQMSIISIYTLLKPAPVTRNIHLITSTQILLISIHRGLEFPFLLTFDLPEAP